MRGPWCSQLRILTIRNLERSRRSFIYPVKCSVHFGFRVNSVFHQMLYRGIIEQLLGEFDTEIQAVCT